MVRILYLLLFCSLFSCKTEESAAQTPNISIKYGFTLPDLAFTNYDKYKVSFNGNYDFYQGGDYTGFAHPEEVLLAYVSIVHENWLHNLYIHPEDAPKIPFEITLQRLRNSKHWEDNFLELQHKYSFTYSDKDVNVIVTHEYKDSLFYKRQAFIITKDKEGRYKILTRPDGDLKILTEFFSFIKPPVLDKIYHQYSFQPTEKLTDDVLIAIYEATKTPMRTFSLTKFIDLLEEWKQKGDTTKVNYVLEGWK